MLAFQKDTFGVRSFLRLGSSLFISQESTRYWDIFFLITLSSHYQTITSAMLLEESFLPGFLVFMPLFPLSPAPPTPFERLAWPFVRLSVAAATRLKYAFAKSSQAAISAIASALTSVRRLAVVDAEEELSVDPVDLDPFLASLVLELELFRELAVELESKLMLELP